MERSISGRDMLCVQAWTAAGPLAVNVGLLSGHCGCPPSLHFAIAACNVELIMMIAGHCIEICGDAEGVKPERC